MKTSIPHRGHRSSAFTLVELMVSTTLIMLVMIMLLSTVDSTQRVWKRTTTKAAQFQAARAALETMTRRLSQATLNTYWRAYDGDTMNQTAEFQFRRHSELQFLSGPAEKIFSSPALSNLNSNPALSYPTHAVFFQAPLGYTEYTGSNGIREFQDLDSMLAGCGYFVEFGDDPTVPDFVRVAGIPPRFRSRLVELSVPAERISIHQRFNDKLGNIEPQVLDANKSDYVGLVDPTGKMQNSWNRPFWMQEALRRESTNSVSYFRYGRVLAENIVALVVLPKLAERDRPKPDEVGSLAPEYGYDSWRILRQDKTVGAKNAARDNLLPPILQVMIVAIDEPSASRRSSIDTDPPNWTDGLFKRVKTQADYLQDVAELETRLREDSNRIDYRIFSADVVIRGSKWSQNL